MTEDEMAEWHHQLNGHELGQTLGDGEGQRDLACCSPWGRKESDMTGQLNNNNMIEFHVIMRINMLQLHTTTWMSPKHTV